MRISVNVSFTKGNDLDLVACMRAFAAVAREGSFTAAGLRLGASTKLISKHVGQLEAHLGAQLLNRTTRSVALTDLGAAYLERCSPLLDQFDELEALVKERQGALSGPIRLTAPTGFGATLLVEALAPFQKLHPEVTIDLRLSDRVVALVEEGLDLAIRIEPLRDSTLVARRLADMPQVICAAPEYLATRATPRAPEDLTDHACLVTGQGDGTWRFRDPGGREMAVRVAGPFHANAPGAVARMAVAGLGIANVPFYPVEADLAAGRLVRLLPGWQAGDSAVHALYPPNRHLTARVRALIDHLQGVFRNRFDPGAVQSP